MKNLRKVSLFLSILFIISIYNAIGFNAYASTLPSKKIMSNPVKVASEKLNKNTDTILVGKTDKLTAIINPGNATNKSVKWTTSNSKIASVDNNGVVKALSVGTVKITATTVDGKKAASCTVKVNPIVKVASVKLNKSTDTILVGKTDKLVASINPGNATNKSVKWSSSNSKIASVDNNGVVKALSVGTVKITATTLDGVKVASCTVNVVKSNYYINDNDIKKLIYNADNTFRSIGTFGDYTNYKYKDGYVELKKGMNTYNSLFSYYNKYFSIKKSNYFINTSLFMNTDNVYYTIIGNPGEPPLILQSQIKNKTVNNNKMNVTLRVYIEGDVDKEFSCYETYTLVYENGRWLVDDSNDIEWKDFAYKKNH
ncbi:MAG: Ig-like domain-containing protein [Clostridium sp.]|uniref:Ig-like domain-containing protein n=1 Tax=Clostridium sp. TaxID=1506 RepID=UPI0039E8E380